MFAEKQWVTKGIRAEGVDVAEGCGRGVAADERVEVFSVAELRAARSAMKTGLKRRSSTARALASPRCRL